MKYNINWLLEKIVKEDVDYLFFWGHKPSPDGYVTKFPRLRGLIFCISCFNTNQEVFYYIIYQRINL